MSLKSASTGLSTIAESFEQVASIRMRSLSLRDAALTDSFAATLSKSSAILAFVQHVLLVQPSLDKILRNILMVIIAGVLYDTQGMLHNRGKGEARGSMAVRDSFLFRTYRKMV